ncbi:HlyD family type I secretion periplasmic adaptor subunit [Roseomonas sp. 18066]|uniref:HlyD family type I secretion periplasmic adaptor subunit n=1 Tax=Roseomonas sp. 18066 TaxID=2681412 RepID=UPI00135B6A75|nr:HlyD family type I secretion periplasmic adaptor subunit [Roseomonas sp. 18066]
MSGADLPIHPPLLRATPPPADARGLMVFGALVLVGFFGIAGVWAALAPLSGAALAPAVVMVDGNRKTVQHQEGGILRSILVRNGDRVLAGAPLLRLDDTTARAAFDVLEAQHLALAITQARLEAERDGAPELALDAETSARRDAPSLVSLIAAQSALLTERRRQLDSATAVIEQQVLQLNEQLGGGAAELDGIERQRQLIADEVEGLRTLLRQHLVPRSRVLALDRTAAALDADRGRVVAEMARAKASIGEARLRILQLRQQRLTEISEALRETGDRMAEVRPRLEAARDLLARTVILAPSDGEVVGLSVFTEGGVVAPGAALLDIVPLGAPLVFQARLRPEDKSRVAAGMAAEIRLSGITEARDPLLRARVAMISADRLSDPATGDSHYAVELQADAADAPTAEVLRRIRLQPGMPAQVTIATEPRSLLDYLVGPLRERLGRAFREE